MIFIIIAVTVLIILVILISLLNPSNGTRNLNSSKRASSYNRSYNLSTSIIQSTSSPKVVVPNAVRENNAIIGSEIIKILSYNLNLNNNSSQKKYYKDKVNTQKKNIIKILKEIQQKTNNLDFICLQEAYELDETDIKQIFDTNIYASKNWQIQNSIKNKLITIWNKKKYGNEPKFYMFSTLKNRTSNSNSSLERKRERLYQFFIFKDEKTKKEICLVNIHNGHILSKRNSENENLNSSDNIKSLKSIKDCIKEDLENFQLEQKNTKKNVLNPIYFLRKSDNKTKYDNINKMSRIILVGDFNCNFKKFKIFGKEFLDNNNLKTCCFYDNKNSLNNTGDLQYSFDHILDSENNFNMEPTMIDILVSYKDLASDHIPIYAELNHI